MRHLVGYINEQVLGFGSCTAAIDIFFSISTILHSLYNVAVAQGCENYYYNSCCPSGTSIFECINCFLTNLSTCEDCPQQTQEQGIYYIITVTACVQNL